MLARSALSVSIMAVGVVGVASAASASTAQTTGASAATKAISTLVNVTGQTQGITLQSQATNSDGSVTVKLKSASGVSYGYSGAPGAELVVSQPVVHNSAGSKPGASITVAVGLAAPNTSALAQNAISRYRHEGRSVTKDAARLGFAVKSSSIEPADTIVTSWCTSVNPNFADTANSCDTRTLLQSSNWYIADQVQTIAQADGASIVTAVTTKLQYASSNTIVLSSPAGTVETSCGSPVTYSVTLFGVGFSVPVQTCGGDEQTVGTGGTLGETAWHGSICEICSGESVAYQPVFETHSTGQSPSTTLVVTMAYTT